jgi:hypothetical protein
LWVCSETQENNLQRKMKEKEQAGPLRAISLCYSEHIIMNCSGASMNINGLPELIII